MTQLEFEQKLRALVERYARGPEGMFLDRVEFEWDYETVIKSTTLYGTDWESDKK